MILITGDWKSDGQSGQTETAATTKKSIFIIAISYDITITPFITQAMRSFGSLWKDRGGSNIKLNQMKRREIIKNLAIIPFAGGFFPSQESLAGTTAFEAGKVSGPLSIGPKIYESIGVDPVINCRGTFTIIGG